MRTDQFRDWDTDKAKEIDRPASRAKASLFSTAVVSSGPYFLVSRPNTAKRAAKVAMRVPANSSLTANQQLALKFKKKAFWLLSKCRSFLARNRFSLLYALIVERPSSVSPKRAYMGDRLVDSSLVSSREV